MYLLTNHGIKEVKENKSRLGKIFCKHDYIIGEQCSKHGMVALNGSKIIKVCIKCGKIDFTYNIKG